MKRLPLKFQVHKGSFSEEENIENAYLASYVLFGYALPAEDGSGEFDMHVSGYDSAGESITEDAALYIWGCNMGKAMIDMPGLNPKMRKAIERFVALIDAYTADMLKQKTRKYLPEEYVAIDRRYRFSNS